MITLIESDEKLLNDSYFLTKCISPLHAEELEITNVGVITGSGSPNYLNGAFSVFVSGDYTYVASYYDDSLSVFDIN